MNYFLRFFFLILSVLLFFSCNNDESDPVLFEVDFKVTNITCNTKGAINLTINGGTPPYSFLWSTNQTTKDIKDIEKEGTYNVTVVDNMGLTKILNIDIKRINSKIDVKAEIAESSVFTDNGSINLIVTGGIPPYKIIWSNSETTNKISNLGPGVYQVKNK